MPIGLQHDTDERISIDKRSQNAFGAKLSLLSRSPGDHLRLGSAGLCASLQIGEDLLPSANGSPRGKL